MYTGDVIRNKSSTSRFQCQPGTSGNGYLTSLPKQCEKFPNFFYFVVLLQRNRARLALGIHRRDGLCHGQDVSLPV